MIRRNSSFTPGSNRLGAAHHSEEALRVEQGTSCIDDDVSDDKSIAAPLEQYHQRADRHHAGKDDTSAAGEFFEFPDADQHDLASRLYQQESQHRASREPQDWRDDSMMIQDD